MKDKSVGKLGIECYELDEECAKIPKYGEHRRFFYSKRFSVVLIITLISRNSNDNRNEVM